MLFSTNNPTLSSPAMRNRSMVYLLLSVNLLIKIIFLIFSSEGLPLLPLPWLKFPTRVYPSKVQPFCIVGSIPASGQLGTIFASLLLFSLSKSSVLDFVSLYHVSFIYSNKPPASASIALAGLYVVLSSLLPFILLPLFFNLLEAKISFSTSIPATQSLVARDDQTYAQCN